MVVLSREAFNGWSGTVIAMAVTGQFEVAGFPLTVELDPRAPRKGSWVKIGQTRTLSTERIGKRIGTISAGELDRIIAGLFEIIGDEDLHNL
ncbi:MAG TPA: type II toxin-antitoxin system PemK/MazF family toxin [Syntrophobacteraceae bacterium]|nr:type II toxin-antitoxin system PemK/MazF family toxin [Syntrophobacteraceae bacterium]